MDWGPAATQDWRGQELTKGFGGGWEATVPRDQAAVQGLSGQRGWGCLLGAGGSGGGAASTLSSRAAVGKAHTLGVLKWQTVVPFWVRRPGRLLREALTETPVRASPLAAVCSLDPGPPRLVDASLRPPPASPPGLTPSVSVSLFSSKDTRHRIRPTRIQYDHLL